MLQIRIHVGVRRETFECLHQGLGQQFDIDAGKACDKVLVLYTRRMTMTLAATFSRDTFRANHDFVSIPYLSINLKILCSFSTCIKLLINLYNNHSHCDL